jgi:hypothetical protein
MDSYSFLLFSILHYFLLTSGTGDHLVCQAMRACSSTLYPNVEDCRGRTGLSPPAAYPSTVEYEANEGSLYPRHHVYAIDYYTSVK